MSRLRLGVQQIYRKDFHYLLLYAEPLSKLSGLKEWPFRIILQLYVGLVSAGKFLLQVTLDGCAAFSRYNTAIISTMAQLYSWQHLLAGGESSAGLSASASQVSSLWPLCKNSHAHSMMAGFQDQNSNQQKVKLEESQAWTPYIFTSAACYGSKGIM